MKNLTPLHLPEVDNIPLSPQIGFYKIYLRNGVVYKLDGNGVETPLVSLIESDPVFTASAAYTISTQNVSDWNTAYAWGNHATQGYLTQAVANTLYAGINHTHSFSQITSKPTTLLGYGITDPVVLTTNSYSDPSWITALNWSKIVGAPSFVTALAALTDVQLTTLSENQVLRYSSGFWRNWTPNYLTQAVADGLYVPLTAVGAVNGVASLNGSGQVPAGQLPSYVDDVLEYASLAAFPTTGETGKIYVALDTNETYRWSGSSYIRIANGAVQSVNSQTGNVVLTTDNVSEGTTNKYYTDARVKTYADTLYVALAGAYSNPSWITSLAWSKITGAPSFLLGTGTTNYVTKWSGTSLVDSIIYENGGVGINTNSVNTQTMLHVVGNTTRTKSLLLDSLWNYQTSFSMKNGNFSTEFNLGGSTKSSNEGGPGSLQVSTYNATTGAYRYPVTFYANGNVAFAGAQGSVPADNGNTLQVNGTIQQTSVTSSLLKTNASGVLVAAVAGVDYLVSVATPTLDAVTTAGNTTTNSITVGGLTTSGNIAFSAYNRTIGSASYPASAIYTGELYSMLNIRNSGNTNGLSFYDSGGTLQMRIWGSGNVTINSATDAGYKLDVNGTARVQTSLEITGAAGLTFGGGATALSWAGGGQLSVGNSATWTNIRFYSGLVEKYSQTTTLTTIANTTINLATSTVQLAGVNALTYSGTDIRIGSVAAGFNSLSMYVAGIEQARISLTGNLLINTTTDAGYKLDVNGTVRAYSATESILRVEQSNGNYVTTVIGNGSALAAGQFGMYFNGGAVWSWNGAAFRLHGNFISSAVPNVTMTVAGGYGGGTSAGVSVKLGSNAYNAGTLAPTSGVQTNVEIGTGSNESWTSSSGNASWNLLRIAPTINTSGTYSGIVRGLYIDPVLTSTTGVTLRAIETTSGDLIFNTQTATTSAGYTTMAIGGSSGAYFQMYVGTNPSTQILRGQIWAVGNNLIFNNPSSGYLGLYTTMYSGITVFPTTGNVHIGTGATDAGYKLDVNGTARFQDHLIFSSTKGIYASSALTTVLQSSTNYFTHNRIGSSGTLGFQIGVVGNVQSFWRYNDGTGDVEFGNANVSYHLGLYAGNTERVKILGNGNVLIGTTTDAGYKLDVNGTLRASGRILQGFGGFVNNCLYTYISNHCGSSGYIGFGFTNTDNPAAGDSVFDIYQGVAAAPGATLFNFKHSILNSINSVDQSFIAVTGTINRSASVSGIVRGIYYNPTTTAVNGTHYAWESTSGKFKISDLSGTGTRMVVADANGVLSTQAIPSGGGGTGTVTSVDLSVPTGFAVSGNPVTTSGTLALAFASGYSLPTTASQTNWDTAYTNRITSLTTTGSSGAATLSGNVLNIPNYSVTADNGVSIATGNIIQLGAPNNSGVALTTNRWINTSTNYLTVRGNSTNQAFVMTNFGSGYAFTADAVGVVARFLTAPSSTNTIATVASFARASSGTAAAGIGSAIEFENQTTSSGSYTSGRIANILTNTSSTPSSKFQFDTLNAGIYNSALTLEATGRLVANQYGVGTFTGTVAYYLAVTSSGQVVEVASVGSSGTVTSVAALTITSTGTDITSSVANSTTTPVITLNVPTASATNRGALSSTDWSTFNNKQAAISLTTTGNSGAATFSSNTLNIPTYTLTGLGGQPLSTNLTSLSGLSYVSASFVKMTAAGTFALDTNTYYLASNPSGYTSNTGTVTSVAALTIGTTGTDITSSVATGTTTPVITLNIPTASAANRGALSSTDWSTFNNKQGTITLTTTGSSGAATFSANTLNIPTYTLTGLGGQPLSTSLTSLSGLTYVSASFVKMTAAGTFALDTNTYYLASNPSGYTTNTGTVTSVSVTTANGVSGSVATSSTTPAITITLGAITPTSVNGLTFTAAATGFTIAGGTTSKTLTVSNTLTFAGTDGSTLNIGAGGTLGSAAFTASTAYQASSTNLTSLAGLTFASTAFVKMTATGTFALDTNTYYLASNPSGYTTNTGTVTTLSVVSANGFAGTVANAGTTPAITLSTTVTGILKGNGTSISAAVAGTDYLVSYTETSTLANVTSRGATTSSVVTLTGGDGTNSSLKLAGYNQRGGVGYHGFLEATNTFGSATNPNKYFRLDNAGTFQIINSAYTATIFNLTDAGDLTATKIIKSGGTSSQLLAADGSVVTAGTGITISGGTINASGTGGGTVTTVSIVSANGFAGTVATASSTPAITLTTTVTGIVKGNGTAFSAAVAGTDYLVSNQTITLSGAVTGSGTTAITTTLASGVVGIANLSATGTPSASTYLRGDNTWATISTSGGYTVTTQTSAYTVTATSGTTIVKGDTTGGTFTILLPTAVGNTATIIIKKTAGAGALVIDGAGSETLDGSLTASLNKINESLTLISDNTNWQII